MFWASTFVVAKAAFAEVSPLAFLFARFVIMVALAFAVLLVLQRGAGRWVERSDWGLFVLAGLTGYTLYQLGFILGLSRTSPFSSSLLIAMVPLFTVLILAVMGEPTPLQGWVGLGVALVGVALFLLDKRGASAGTLLGDLLSIGAAVSFAVYGIITRPLVRKYPAETYTAWSVLAGAVPLLLVSLPDALRQDWQAVSLRGVVEHRLPRHLPGLHRLHPLELRHRPARRGQGQLVRPAGADRGRAALGDISRGAVRPLEAARGRAGAGRTRHRADPGMAATGRERSDRVSVPTTDSKMYQTMQRQPADIRRLLADGWEQAEQAADPAGPGAAGLRGRNRHQPARGDGRRLAAARRRVGRAGRLLLRLRPLPGLLSPHRRRRGRGHGAHRRQDATPPSPCNGRTMPGRGSSPWAASPRSIPAPS